MVHKGKFQVANTWSSPLNFLHRDGNIVSNLEASVFKCVVDFSQVAREYEKIFDDLLNNKDKCLDSKEKQMEAEREQAWEHLSANEQSYAEVCKRNNKLKLIISGSRLVKPNFFCYFLQGVKNLLSEI